MKPEVEDYLRRARRDLDAAKANLELGYAVVAASRGYYAMFHAAKALLSDEEMSFSKHSAVIAAFGQRFGRTGRVPPELHRFLIAGQELRLNADYDLPDAPMSEAQEQVRRAEEFLRVAEAFFRPLSEQAQGPA